MPLTGRNLWIIAPGHELRGARKAVVLSTNERFSAVLAIEEDVLSDTD
jgi:hypothetical protein